ncbi:MAG: Bax inhibitor-1 family protein [Pseudomonadota bacterium]
MSTNTAQYAGIPVSNLPAEERKAFIWRTYAHVVGAILAFAGIESYFFSSGVAATFVPMMLQQSWLLILGAFMIVSWGASYLAMRIESRGLQYATFAVFVFAQAIITMPLLAIAMSYPNASGMIESAAVVTLIGAAGLMAVVMITGKDFSFLRSIMVWGGILALVAIVSAVIFGFELGTWFSVAMIGFAGGAILYDTSNIMRHYPADRHVAAAMALFASIAMMFWYVLRLFMSRE